MIKKYMKYKNVDGSKVKSSSQFKAMVGNNDFQVVFNKKDGSERTMNGSVNVKRMPKFLKPKGNDGKSVSTRVVKEDIVTVLDTDEMSWKSFKVERLINVVWSEGR